MPRITVRSGTLIFGTSSPIAVNASSPVALQLSAPGTATAGDSFLLGTITAQDTFGNTATTYSGSKSITYTGPNDGPRAGKPSYTTDVFFDRGISTTPLRTTLVCAGTTTITVQAGSIIDASSMLTVLPGGANCFDVRTERDNIETAGVPFSINITSRDIFGNIATKHEGNHDINCWWNAIPVGNISPVKPEGIVQAAFNKGQATVDGFTLVNTGQTPLIAVYEGNIRGTGSPITVKPASIIHHLQIITEHSGTEIAGVAFAAKVIACDQLGNPTEYMGTERIDLAWENANGSPVLPISGSYTFKTGNVTIPGFMITNTGDTPVIRAQFGTITGTSSPIIVSSGQAASFRIIAPTPVTMDVSFNLTGIIAQDICGNTATTYTGSKVLTYNPAGTGTSYTSPVYFNQGISQSLLQTTLTVAETVQLRVTDGNISGVSNSITIKPGSITSLEVTTEHQGTETAGISFSVILTLRDKKGNTVTNYSGSLPVVWSWTAGNSPNNGTPTRSNDGEQAFTNGVSRISGFILTRAGEFPCITARIGSLTSSSLGITVKSNAAFSFKVIAAGSSVVVGASFTLTITALDAFGNIAAEYSGTKSLIYSGPGQGPISGTPTYPSQIVNFASGVVAQRLEMSLVRAEETMIKVEQGNISGYSQKIVATPANPGRFVLSTYNQGTVTAGRPFIITIVAKDVYGNDAKGYTDLHPLIWGWDEGTRGFRPDNGNQSFDSGIGSVTGFTLFNATQTRIWVSDLIISGTITIDVTPGTASYFDIRLPSPVTAGQPFDIGSIKAMDSFGNIDTNYSGTRLLIFSGPGEDSYGNKPSYPPAIVFEQGIAVRPITMPMTITLRKPETVQISIKDGNVSGTSNTIEVVDVRAGCLVWPHEVYACATQTINYSVINLGDSGISQVCIIIPFGFTYIEAGIPVVSTKQLWSAIGNSINIGQYILLTPNNNYDYLPKGAILTVPITVATKEDEQEPIKWISMVTGEQGTRVWAQEVIDGDSEVSITAYILSCSVSTNAVLAGGAATITAKLIYQPTEKPKIGEPVKFFRVTDGQKSIEEGTVYTDGAGQADINITAGTTTGSITVEARYGLFNTRRVSFQVISPVPKISAGANSHTREGMMYVNPATPFYLTSFGSFTCEYKLDKLSWQKFSLPFTIDSPGEHIISYRFVDSSNHPGCEYAANVFVSPIQTETLTNFPNPFNLFREETTIQYYLTRPADVHIQIYNLFGELVWMKDMPAGQQGVQQIPWNGRNGDGEVVGNGSYICRVIIKYPSGDVVMSRKIGVVK
ncbi:hypothetical protein HY792_01350 [Candidatus Desantisbacteria bacterium]|nr:hypothetical protein [Candidatus Desantisbacteria bacterium]